MDASSFDAWTRRRFGLALGSGAAVLLGLTTLDDTEAKKGKNRCRHLRQGCKPSGQKKKCCKGLKCDELLVEGPNHCCVPVQGKCEDAGDCCGDAICDQIDGLGDATRCCGVNERSCKEDHDCCSGFTCDGGTCVD